MTQSDMVESRDVGFVVLSLFEEGSILKPGQKVDYAFTYIEEDHKARSYQVKIMDVETEEILWKSDILSAYGNHVEESSQEENEDSSDEENLVEEEIVTEEEIATEEENISEDEKLDGKQSEEELYDCGGNLTIPQSILDGYYVILFSFFDNKNTNIGTIHHHFFVSSLALKVQSVGSYPSVVYPGGECLIYTNISTPKNFDSDVIWFCDGVEIYSSRLADMPPAVKWRAPKDKTVVELSVGIFPMDPPEGSVFNFKPPVSLKTTVFISANQPMESGDFRPDSQYDVLFHFRGEMNDFSPYAQSREIKVVGEPQLTLDSSVFGYTFTQGAALEIASLDELVRGEKKSQLKPLTFDMRLNLNSEAEGTLFSVFSKKGQSIFTLSKEAKKINVSIDLPHGNVIQSLDLTPYQLTELKRLSFSILQDNTELSFLWRIDGYQVGQSIFSYENPLEIDSYKVLIGGKKGYEGVFDEWGIFRADKRENSSLLVATLEKRFGDKLIFADDFVAPSEDEIYQQIPNKPFGASMKLTSGEVLETIPLSLPQEGFSLQVALGDGEISTGKFYLKGLVLDQKGESLSEEVLMVMDLDETTFKVAETTSEFSWNNSSCGLYRFDFIKTANKTLCSFGGKNFDVEFGDSTHIVFGAVADEDELISLDSLVLLSTVSEQGDVYKIPVSLLWQP